jgi:GT2 family glycosyltransferase
MMSEENPKVSVVMPVYNGESYLSEAIESILAQTFENFEFVIVNDGSTDNSEEIIRSFPDERIRLINQSNRGLVESLNCGLHSSRGTYIARMDADDVCAPSRLEAEIKLFLSCPSLSVVGTSIKRIDPAGRLLKVDYYLANDAEIRQEMLLDNPFAHGSIMMRRDFALQAGGYRSEYWPAEDYDLWRRMASLGELANILEPLYLHRENSGTTPLHQSRRSEVTVRISNELLSASAPLRDLPLRQCLRRYEHEPRSVREVVQARVISNYYRVLLAYGARGMPLLALCRLARLTTTSGKAGFQSVARNISRKVNGVRSVIS